MRTSSLHRAFTLIELMVVILMIAVMASVVVPAYNHFYSKAQFENQAREVQDIFAFARETAIDRNTTVTVSYDSGSHAFKAQVAPPQPQTDVPVALQDTNQSGRYGDPPRPGPENYSTGSGYQRHGGSR